MIAYVIGGAAIAVAAATGWALLERHAAGEWQAKAVIEQAAGEQARLAAAANARVADFERTASARLQERVNQLAQVRGDVQTKVITVVREIYRASDAYSPAGDALRLARDRLRQLDATGPRRVRADAATATGGTPGAAGAPAGPRPRLGQADFGGYCVSLLGYAIGLEWQIVKLGEWYDDAAAALPKAPAPLDR